MNNILSVFFANNFDQQISLFFLSHRSNFGITFFEFITFFGNWQLLLPFFAIIVLVLAIKNKSKYILPYILAVGGGEAITFLAKIWFHRLRPLLAVLSESDFSFPSGHAAIAVTFYGYLAYIFIKLLPNRYKKLVIGLTVLLMVLIGFSRLYLGVHYFSDVLVGYVIGFIFLTISVYLTKLTDNHFRDSIK